MTITQIETRQTIFTMINVHRRVRKNTPGGRFSGPKSIPPLYAKLDLLRNRLRIARVQLAVYGCVTDEIKDDFDSVGVDGDEIENQLKFEKYN